MEQRALNNVNNCWNTNIYSYLETSGGQISSPYLNVVHFSTPVLIRHLWQLKTVIFLHWCLLCAVLFDELGYHQKLNDQKTQKNVKEISRK